MIALDRPNRRASATPGTRLHPARGDGGSAHHLDRTCSVLQRCTRSPMRAPPPPACQVTGGACKPAGLAIEHACQSQLLGRWFGARPHNHDHRQRHRRHHQRCRPSMARLSDRLCTACPGLRPSALHARTVMAAFDLHTYAVALECGARQFEPNHDDQLSGRRSRHLHDPGDLEREGRRDQQARPSPSTTANDICADLHTVRGTVVNADASVSKYPRAAA